MPRPLAYTQEGRLTESIFLKDDLDSGSITRREYNAEIKRLNEQEIKYRNRQKKRFETERQKQLRKRQLAEAKKNALEKIKKAFDKRLPAVIERKRIAKERAKYLSSIKLVKKSEKTRFNGRLTQETYDVNPSIPLTLIGAENSTDEAMTILIDKMVNQISNQNAKLNIVLYINIYRPDGETGEPRYATIGKAFSYPYDRNEIKDRMIAELNKQVLKGRDSRVILVLEGVVYKYSRNPESGGCDGNTHHHTNNGLKIMSPKSSKNNCLFACIHHKLDKRIMCDSTRKELGIPLNTPIKIEDLENIAKYYDVSIKLHDLTGAYMQTYNENGKVECKIMLYVNNNGSGHYVLIEGETHVCNTCGQHWVKKHKCLTTRRKMWLNRMSGKRNVIPAKILKDEGFNKNQMLYFDLETFKPEGTDKIIVYASSWFCDGKYYQSYGKNSWNDFMEFVMAQKNKVICAYNGAGFDFHFIMNDLIARGQELTNVILANSRLMSLKFGDNMRLWDICLFTLSSLKDACKSFGVSDDNAKTEFDHFKIRSWDDVEKYRTEVEPYIKRDVMGMKEVVEKFSEMLYEVFKVHMTEFVTLSSMSYAIWTGSVTELLELPDTEQYDFIRKSLYGGRTYPMQREFTSKQYNKIVNAKSSEELKETYKTMDDWIFNGDATSLYPTAMVKYEYPIGNGYWFDGTEINKDDLKIGIYDVDITPNQNLSVPILPEKTANGGISWNLQQRRGVYTSADLENAVRFGYKIDKVHKGLVYHQKGDIFTDYIMKCYKIKEENDANPVLRQIGKILMNALYGKMLERARFEESKICNNIEDIWKFQTEFGMTDVMFLGDKVVAIGLPLDEEISDSRIRKPSQIGTFILSYSRRHMIDIMDAIEPGLERPFFTYTDTDSLHIHCSKLAGLDQKGWLSKGLGQLSDDAKGGKIFREINLAPKLYMYLCLMPDGKIKTCMKSKGIPAQYLSPHLFNNADELEPEEKLILMEHRLKKVGLGKNLQIDWRKYDAFSILSVDMERTFYKNQWNGMKYENNLWTPNK